MATRSPTGGPKSLRDRIARFEADVPAPKSPISPRLKTPGVNGKITAAGRTSNPATLSSKQSKAPTIHSSPRVPVGDLKAIGVEKTVIVESTPEAQRHCNTTETPTSPKEQPPAFVMGVEKAVIVESTSEAQTNSSTAESLASPKEQTTAVFIGESSSIQTISSESSSLDALLSPIASEVYGRDFVRESTREELEDSDIRFSTIPLSGQSFDEDGKCQPSFSSPSSGTPSINDSVFVEQEFSQPEPWENTAGTSSTLTQSADGHKKDSVSSLTTVPFLMNRLDKQEEMNDMSLGSNRQLQEEFMRIQKQRANAATEAQQINWGQYACYVKGSWPLTVLCRLLGRGDGRYGVYIKGRFDLGLTHLDYHRFARENSDELARAIESGIPSSLRGMMWQLM
jgi:hypothetical protein